MQLLLKPALLQALDAYLDKEACEAVLRGRIQKELVAVCPGWSIWVHNHNMWRRVWADKEKEQACEIGRRRWPIESSVDVGAQGCRWWNDEGDQKYVQGERKSEVDQYQTVFSQFWVVSWRWGRAQPAKLHDDGKMHFKHSHYIHIEVFRLLLLGRQERANDVNDEWNAF